MKIDELTLLTADVQEQFRFYTEVLGLPGKMAAPDSCSIQIGQSVLLFKQSTTKVHYHFAINIPEKSANKALNWLAKKCEVILDPNDSLFRFDSWRADAFYFRDSAGNLVELIAREGIGVESKPNFDVNFLLNISEVGMGSKSIELIHEQLKNQGNIPVYSGDYNRFCALGDAQGLIIIVNPENKTWFPTNDPVIPSELVVRGDYNFRFSDGNIQEIN